ncbi:hypothetical protein OUZ56_023022 [Daphnia magna]|uniref:Uncharacterized protein n=1 Tax=Daphnia magna TaxID=35525 RepID=A0ABR0AY73_9CRUS|nr:hypothetical protein OUZ56_023022 [Daphnia magna]
MTIMRHKENERMPARHRRHCSNSVHDEHGQRQSEVALYSIHVRTSRGAPGKEEKHHERKLTKRACRSTGCRQRNKTPCLATQRGCENIPKDCVA